VTAYNLEMCSQTTRYIPFKNGQIALQGDGANKKIILLIGRSNTQKNSAPLSRLLSELQMEGYTLIWHQSKSEATSELLSLKVQPCIKLIPNIEKYPNHLTSKIIRKLIKALILLAYPSQWGYFFPLKQQDSLCSKIKQYRTLLQNLGVDKEITILAHSAGGRVASMLDTESNVKNLICFGYPFKDPKSGEDPTRIRNLEIQQKPFLIIQGRNDEYGGEDILKRYQLSKSISIQFIEANHDYEYLSDESWEIVTRAIEDFLRPKQGLST
jgi:uncharacterized protein